jgi:predicted GNAT family N-acyltransferase
MRIKVVSDEKELALAFKIRELVFMEEQNVSKELERDGLDKEASHILVSEGEKSIGTARMRILSGGKVMRVERMALLKDYRGKGRGKKMVDFLINLAKDEGVEKIFLHAQYQVRNFYKKCGFRGQGERFMEAGIPHIGMYKKIR